MNHQLPDIITTRIRNAGAIGFTGSRVPTAPAVTAEVIRALFHAIPADELPPVLVGCARGVDALVRHHVPESLVFSAHSHIPADGSLRPYHFALRSARMVETLALFPVPLLIALPAAPPPARLLPSCKPRRCFAGHGSGTWGTIAYAAGLRLPVLLWSPSSLLLSQQWNSSPLTDGWSLLEATDPRI